MVEGNFLHGKILTVVVEAEWVVPVVKVMIQVIVNTIAGPDNLRYGPNFKLLKKQRI